MKTTKNHSVRTLSLPFETHAHQSENASTCWHNGHEVVEDAVVGAEEPVVVEVEREREADVEEGNGRVGDGQVEQEVVGDGAHPTVSEHQPDHHQIATDRHHDDDAERDDVDQLRPPPLHERELFAVQVADVVLGDDAAAVAASGQKLPHR